MATNILVSLLAEEEKKNLLESVTFHAAIIADYDGRKMYDTAHFQKAEQQECWVCKGTGKDPYHRQDDCGMCDGKKEVTEYVTPYKALNVSNSNAVEIMNILGLRVGDDLSGCWSEKEMPAIRRKLIVLKNKDTSKHVVPSSDTQGPARAVKDENGQSRISRGVRMIDGGTSASQIDHYIDTLLALIDFAQKNDAVVTWC